MLQKKTTYGTKVGNKEWPTHAGTHTLFVNRRSMEHGVIWQLDIIFSSSGITQYENTVLSHSYKYIKPYLPRIVLIK